MFESFVNLEGCKTKSNSKLDLLTFESFVNLEGCKTDKLATDTLTLFESFVNLEGCKTNMSSELTSSGLRALLI